MKLPYAVALIAACATLARGDDGPRFSTAAECALCHTRIPGPDRSWSSAEWVGPSALWQGTMMAHSSADPYWRAKVRFEVEQGPERRAEIEDTCLRCHAPADQYPLRAAGKRLALEGVGDLGKEGVSCTVCHQILATGLGRTASFTGGFLIGTDNIIFGPHPGPFTMPMLHHTGFEPREAKHILDSALCGSCHTVITQPPGQPQVQFVEQAPFLEWLASSYPQSGQTCQRCHMPQLEDESGRSAAQYIAHRPPGGPFPPTQPRSPFGQHQFAGGNAMIPELLAREGAAEAVPLRAAGERARRQLERSLNLRVTTRQEDGLLLASIDVINLAGHKLPTGFPSRRLWLHVALIDARQQTLFDSGAWDPSSGELLVGGAFQPHHRVIEKPGQVQVFETEALDSKGLPTLSLLNAASHRKDNRILPAGFDVQRLAAAGLEGLEIGSSGLEGDGGFRSGSARTLYRIPLPSSGNGHLLKVEVLFQTIKPSHRPASFRLADDLSHPVVVARFETVL